MRQIAAKAPCGHSIVVRTLKRFSETNFIAEMGRSGRPRKTSLREGRLLLSNRKLNSSQILKQWTLTSNLIPVDFAEGRLQWFLYCYDYSNDDALVMGNGLILALRTA
ncbi:hypothetical protein TNCV_2329771 [Trichonephila clavipes]|nr:hypothetical protein TNCV_2329771 [Trichonephila clavipes]